MGRTASHFYISYDSVEIFNQSIKPFMNMSEILSMISSAKEFDQLKVYYNKYMYSVQHENTPQL
jgi:activating signal cointegrator complex subunit 3